MYLCRDFMTEYTEGIVLHLGRHTDKMRILYAYTRSRGRASYAVYGLHGKSGKIPVASMQPLSLVGLEVSHPASENSLPTLRTAHLLYTSQRQIPDIRRQAIAIFLAEVLYRTLTLPQEDAQLFDYLRDLIQILDTTPSPENLHLCFMLQFARYMGFSPMLDSEESVWDMQLSEMRLLQPEHDDFFLPAETRLLRLLEEDHTHQLPRSQRQQLLHKLCRYYELHIDGFTTPKSLDVLEQLFDE